MCIRIPYKRVICVLTHPVRLTRTCPCHTARKNYKRCTGVYRVSESCAYSAVWDHIRTPYKNEVYVLYEIISAHFIRTRRMCCMRSYSHTLLHTLQERGVCAVWDHIRAPYCTPYKNEAYVSQFYLEDGFHMWHRCVQGLRKLYVFYCIVSWGFSHTLQEWYVVWDCEEQYIRTVRNNI